MADNAGIRAMTLLICHPDLNRAQNFTEKIFFYLGIIIGTLINIVNCKTGFSKFLIFQLLSEHLREINEKEIKLGKAAAMRHSPVLYFVL